MSTRLSPRAVVHQSYLCHPDWDAQVHHGFLLQDADECFTRDEIPPIPVIREWLAEERYSTAVSVVDRALKGCVDRGELPLARLSISQAIGAALREAGLLR